MKIKLPTMVGIKSHARISSKLMTAVSNKDFPIDLDCADTVFTTSGFCTFIIKSHKAAKIAGGVIRLINVSADLFEGIKIVHLNDIIEVFQSPILKESNG